MTPPPTDTLRRPPLTRPAPVRRGKRPDPLRSGVPAALWAFVAGLVIVAIPVLLGWAAEGRSGSDARAALAAVGQIWVVAHGASLAIPGGSYDLLPIGLVALPVLLLRRAGRHAAAVHPVPTLRAAGALMAAIALPYAACAATVAALAGTASIAPAPLEALLGAALVALIGGGWGVLTGAGLWPALVAVVPARVQLAARAGLAATGGLLALGAALFLVLLAVHGGRVADLTGATGPGLVGGLLLIALCLFLAPLGAVWASCWLVGPGFAVGTGTAVGPFSTQLGAVPSFPLLAPLPGGPVPVWVGVLVMALPLALGALAGEVVRRQGGGLVEAALAGPFAGVALAGLAWLSAGSVGGGRMATVGPVFWQVGPAFAGAVTVGALLLVLVRRWWAGRTDRFDPEATAEVPVVSG